MTVPFAVAVIDVKFETLIGVPVSTGIGPVTPPYVPDENLISSFRESGVYRNPIVVATVPNVVVIILK
jgi:hypothetical protein